MRLALILLALLLAAATHSPHAPIEDERAPGQLRLGMSPQQVIDAIGHPLRTSRQVLAHRSIEQWQYGQPRPRRLVFHCMRGQKPVLHSARDLPAQPAP